VSVGLAVMIKNAMDVKLGQPDMPCPTRHRLHPTPDRLIIALMAVEALLWLSDRIGWPAWHKGYAVLTAMAMVGMAILLMLGWFAVSVMLRWRFQFGIRSLLLLVVAVAVPCRWLAVEMKKAERQRQAIVSLEEVGGEAFDAERICECHGCQVVLPNFPVTKSWPLGPSSLRWLLGEHLFVRVVEVRFPRDVNARRERMVDEELRHLTALNHLEVLDLSETSVSDAGLVYLEELSTLKEVRLGCTGVTSSGVERLQRSLPHVLIRYGDRLTQRTR